MKSMLNITTLIFSVIAMGFSVGVYVTRTEMESSSLEERIQSVESLVSNSVQLSNGKLYIDGICFEPKVLVRCFNESDKNHMTWINGSDVCERSKFSHRHETKILAQVECE